MALSSTQVITRGATAKFTTTFFDVNGAITQPDNAAINFSYYRASDQTQQTAQVPMTPPTGGAVTWTALWDTRNVFAPSVVYWSIHTGMNDPIPVAAEDGQFLLAANPANLPSF